MEKILVYGILVIIIVLAVFGTVKRIRYGSSCCGEKEPAPRKVKVGDRNKNNYPYLYELNVDGMHCGNCARRVENALNSIDGLWGTADIGRNTVTLRSKREAGEDECRKAISQAGYTMLSMKKIGT